MQRPKTGRLLLWCLMAGLAGSYAVDAVGQTAAAAGPSARPLPPGHPPIGSGAAPVDPDDEDDGTDPGDPEGSDLPPGHPSGPSELPPGHPPTAAGRQAAGPVEMPAESSAQADPAVPAGSVVVQVHDPSGRPLARVPVALDLLVQTIAKSDARRHLVAESDETGAAHFDRLPVGSTASYRASVNWSGPDGSVATYNAPPFQLDLAKGERVRIPVYPVTREIGEAAIGMQGGVYIEVRDEVLQLDEIFQIYNFGRTTWVPKDVVLQLPAGAKAFQAEASMDGTAFEADGEKVRLRGTFSPGRHDVEMRYQVPYSPGDDFRATLAMPPHVVRMRVLAEASKDARLEVAGFGKATVERNTRGQRILAVDRQLRPGDAAMSRLEVSLENLPGPGSARNWAAGLAAGIMALGVYLGTRRPTSSAGTGESEEAEARIRVVDELQALERARETGQVGPKTYARARQELLDALARLLPADAP